jgi:gliding motility-associated-like protein
MRSVISFFLFIFFLDSAKAQNCNNWLQLSSFPSFARIGDLDIPGDKLTIEAMFNRTAPYTGAQVWAGDLVSKHLDFKDANYLLRPNGAEITTSNGYFKTPDICDINLNKTYHVAMVYDGVELRFYRNGFLMSKIAATGTLFQNDWQTQIGLYQDQVANENLIGYINEVRIWNIARTQQQIQAYINSPLPSPATQNGLLAYYTFDNLLNKQGNTKWNIQSLTNATIAKTNPTCISYSADSCCTPVTASISAVDICSGESPAFTFQATGGTAPFQINYTDGTNALTQNNVSNGSTFNSTITLTANTTFNFMNVKDAKNCVTPMNTSTPVKVKPLPEGKFITQPVCAGDTARLQFSAVKGVQPFTLSYELGNTPYTLTNIAGGYNFFHLLNTTTPLNMVSLKDQSGCENKNVIKDTIHISPKPQVQFDSIAPFCLHDQATINLTAKEITGVAGSGTFTGANVTNNIFNAAAATTGKHTITYTYTSGDGCVATQQRNIIMYALPDVRTGTDMVICKGSAVQLKAAGALSYQWSPANDLDNVNTQQVTATPEKNIIYSVTGTDNNGCKQTDSIQIKVLESLTDLHIPNAFTPNGDGINDTWQIPGISDVITTVAVYNRFGANIFLSQYSYTPWNGTFNNKKLPPGTYYYTLKVSGNCRQNITGAISILY